MALLSALARLDTSFSPTDSLRKVRNHVFTLSDSVYAFNLALAVFWLYLMESPSFPAKLIIPLLYLVAILIPFTSQFFLPAMPIFAYLLTFYSSRFIPESHRPSISVSLLPTLESVLYGANISDLLTRFTHPVLDIIAWFPYGVGHYIFPFLVAAVIWLFRQKQALHLWARVFGYMNLTGVLIQILFPCAAPWYELIYGLTPATYAVRGSPGGLARIDTLFHSSTYTTAFSNSPVVFGAFPSLHAACATLEALFISHFFPYTTRFAWTYAGILYWATMYLTHHYLIDVVFGACLAVAFFYLFLPDDLKGPLALSPPTNPTTLHSKYDLYDLEAPRSRTMADASDFDLTDTSSSDEEVDITYRSPVPTPASDLPFIVPGAGRARSSGGVVQQVPRRSHRHTASIASLIRADERGEEGWSPSAGAGFVFPPASARAS
jgi:hypothetical protein